MKKHKNKILIILAVVVVLALIFGLGGDSTNGSDVATVRVGDLVRTVRVSGKVVPEQHVDLAFKSSGIVGAVYKKVGDRVSAGEPIVALEAAAVSADFTGAQADLAAALAEEAKAGVGTASGVAGARREAAQDIFDAYAVTDDAIHNKVDQLFENPRSPNPEILFLFDDYQLRNKINADRVLVESILADFARSVNGDIEYSEALVSKSRAQLSTISTFIADVARAVNDFEAGGTYTQAVVDDYKADIASARTAVNSALSSIVAAEASVNASATAVPVQSARVAAARAAVERLSANLGDSVIRAPFSGIVSKQDAKVGAAASQGTALVSIMSGTYEIEALVPEVSIAGLGVGNVAKVTLDAYGSQTFFSATVDRIDPAETVRDGVSNYKVYLGFSSADERVRSGMTANVEVETLREQGKLLVPSRAVLDREGSKVVRVKDGDESVERVITTGRTDSEGNVEVLSGISEGEQVLLDPVTE